MPQRVKKIQARTVLKILIFKLAKHRHYSFIKKILSVVLKSIEFNFQEKLTPVRSLIKLRCKISDSHGLQNPLLKIKMKNLKSISMQAFFRSAYKIHDLKFSPRCTSLEVHKTLLALVL